MHWGRGLAGQTRELPSANPHPPEQARPTLATLGAEGERQWQTTTSSSSCPRVEDSAGVELAGDLTRARESCGSVPASPPNGVT